MNNQMKNTINSGDSFRDAMFQAVMKQRVTGEWLGSVESDRSVKPYDMKIGRSTGLRLFGVPISGRVRLAWKNANIHERLSLSTPLPLDYDVLVHVRESKTGEKLALIIEGSNIEPYVSKYSRDIYRKRSGTWQRQFNVPAPLPNEGSKKWFDLLSYCSHVVLVDELVAKASRIEAKVNKVGRIESSSETSNRFDNKRKQGVPYKER